MDDRVLVQVLSEIGPAKAKAVLQKLRELGENDAFRMKHVKIEDFTEGGLLKVEEARKLISAVSKRDNDHSGLYFMSIFTI